LGASSRKIVKKKGGKEGEKNPNSCESAKEAKRKKGEKKKGGGPTFRNPNG